MNGMDRATLTSPPQPLATASFSQHSLLATVTVLRSIIGAAAQVSKIHGRKTKPILTVQTYSRQQPRSPTSLAALSSSSSPYSSMPSVRYAPSHPPSISVLTPPRRDHHRGGLDRRLFLRGGRRAVPGIHALSNIPIRNTSNQHRSATPSSCSSPKSSSRI